nr:hypothetical protein [Pandoravirus massiliensis]
MWHFFLKKKRKGQKKQEPFKARWASIRGRGDYSRPKGSKSKGAPAEPKGTETGRTKNGGLFGFVQVKRRCPSSLCFQKKGKALMVLCDRAVSLSLPFLALATVPKSAPRPCRSQRMAAMFFRHPAPGRTKNRRELPRS